MEVYGDGVARHNGRVSAPPPPPASAESEPTAAPAPAAPGPARAVDGDALAALLASELARWGVPGAVAGFSAAGAVTVRAAGVTSLAHPAPVTEETLFRVASITKPFTATLAALLAAEGLLDLDAPVRRAVPGLRLADPATAEAVTPRHLLAHLSGLECEPPHHVVEGGAADEGALARLVARFGEVGQLTPLGDVWSYCNTGYWLAGHAVALAAGAPFERAATDLLLRPLGMDTSGFVHDGAAPPDAALGHAPRRPGDPAHDPIPGYRFARSRVPSGGLVSTVPDLLRFAGLHLAAPAGSPQAAPAAAARTGALAALRDPVADAVAARWGTGWSVEQLDGTVLAAHSGSYGGFQCQLLLAPERAFAAVVLTNSGRGSALVRTVMEWALEHALGLRRPAPAPLALAPAELAAHEGTYRAQHLEVEVRRHGDGLRAAQRVALPDGGTAEPPPLVGVPIAPGRFTVLDGEARGAVFDFPAPGRVRLSSRLALAAPPQAPRPRRP